ENPPALVKSVSQVVDLDDGSSQLAATFDAPDNRVHPGVNRPGRTSAMVQVNRAQSNHRAEALLPCKFGYLHRQVRILLKFQPAGTGRLLILVDHQRSCETHAV